MGVQQPPTGRGWYYVCSVCGHISEYFITKSTAEKEERVHLKVHK